MTQYSHNYYILLGDNIMPRIIPMKDLRNTNEMMDMCKESNDPIFVTKNGYGELVVMSMEAYESLRRSNEIDKAITQYESDIANHVQGKDARTLFSELKEEYLEHL